MRQVDPWDDDDARNKTALVNLLGPDPDEPTNSTLPVDGGPAIFREDGPPALYEERVTAPTTPSFQPSTFQGFTPNHAFEGFDFGREQNTGRSAKDAFAWLANQAPPPPLNNKDALGAWFNQYIAPGMNALGHRITGSQGDTFGFENWQGNFNVDFGRGAGAEGGALAWQVDPATAQMPNNPTYQPQGAQPPPEPPGNQLIDGINIPWSVRAPDDNPSAMDEIIKEIEALMSGGASPMDRRALQGLLT